MKIVQGDLLKMAMAGEFDVIVHGCNCFHNFGAGIALQILRKFPQAFETDKKTPYGTNAKLGTISSCIIPMGTRSFVIVNAYTQFGCGVRTPQVNYEALRNCFKCIKKEFSGNRIGYPLIGCGLARGSWDIVSKIIDEELKSENHTLVEYSRKE